MPVFEPDIDPSNEAAAAAVNGSSVRTNTPDTTLVSTARNSMDSTGIARSPQPDHLATNLGIGSTSPFEGSTAMGAFASAPAIGSAAFGYHALAKVSRSCAVGNQAQATAYRAIALGAFANARHPRSTAIGSYSKTTAPNQTVIGGSEFWFGRRQVIAPAKSLVNNTTTEIFRIAVPNPSAVAFQVVIGISVSDGTNTQSYSATASVAALHDAGGYSSTITTVAAATQLGAGGSTLAVTISMTQPATDIMAFNLKSNTGVIAPTSILAFVRIDVSGETTVTLV